MGKYQRTKGHSWERQVAILMRELFPDARRGMQSRDGADAPDVEGTPYHVECKVGKLPNPRAALYQAIRDAKGKRPAVAVVKDDRCTPFVVMTLPDWMQLARRAHWTHDTECDLDDDCSCDES